MTKTLAVNRPSNLEIQKYYFDKFCAQYELPKGEVIHGDRPDVIIKSDSILGVEITNFYTDPNGIESDQMARRRNATKKAQKFFLDKAGENIEYTFGFNRALPIQNIQQMSTKLHLLADRFASYPIGQVPNNEFGDVAELSFVWRGAEYKDCEWRVTQTFSLPIMDTQQLVKIIQNKEKKAKKYTKCDKLWLLIVVNFMDLAQDQEIMNVDIKEIQSDIFDKVILYKTTMEQIREVPLKR